MSGIDGVGGVDPPIEPEGPDGPGEIGGPDDVEDASRSLGDRIREGLGAKGTESTAASSPSDHHERIHSTIVEGLRRSDSREQIMSDVIEAEVARMFGTDVPDEMNALVKGTFATNPELQGLFDVLYAHAVQSRQGDEEL